MKNIDKLSIATIRSLCIDITNKANSGHPGMALSIAPTMYTLFAYHLNASSEHSNWINRDRFVLSAGHASSLLYSLLHLCGYKLTLNDLKNFRQLNSKTPGHPEVKWTDGVDATAGPLGQGIAQAIGMAVAELNIKHLYTDFSELMNHYTYVVCGDGCLQEGISQEAISFAGHHKLNKLILFYDANDVTLDGKLDLSFSENIEMRFHSCNWNVIEVKDGNDVDCINDAICKAKKSMDKPTLIYIHTIIGFGSSKQGTNKVHGSPLGIDDGNHAKKEIYGFDYPEFYIPEEVYGHFKDTFIKRGEKLYSAYENTLEKYEKSHKLDYERFLRTINNDISDYLPNCLPDFDMDKPMSTRVASGKFINTIRSTLFNLYGGAADVASSVMTKLDTPSEFLPNSRNGHNINFGIREFLMASIQNGMLLHGGIRTYVGSFFVFSDYMKSAIRTSAISKIPSIYIFTHDSIAVGEDGPTHEPIEQLAALRSMPNVITIRPCDAKETYAAWIYALKSTLTPTALILSRQNLPIQKNSSLEGVFKGGYVISKENKKIDLSIIASGSEVDLAIKVQQILLEKNVDVRIISFPSWEIFEAQSEEYQNEVFGVEKSKRVSLEMLSTFGWSKWADHNIGIDCFGLSAPAKDVLDYFGFTPEKIAKKILKILGK